MTFLFFLPSEVNLSEHYLGPFLCLLHHKAKSLCACESQYVFQDYLFSLVALEITMIFFSNQRHHDEGLFTTVWV